MMKTTLLQRSVQPIIHPDQTWEKGGRIFPVAAFADPVTDELLLYYMLRFPGRPLDNVLCLARSKDANSWTKPDYGSGTNIVMRGCGNANDWGEFFPTSIIRDEHEPESGKRWKMIYWDCPDPAIQSGICLATSPDGVQWDRLHTRPVITGANDAASMIDMHPGAKTPFGAGTHFIHQQTFKHNPALPTDRDNLKQLHRAISVWQCEDFAGRWLGPVRILEPDADDAADLQFYWLAAFKTPNGGYGGFLNCHHTIDQTMDVQLVSSSDGWSWTRENDRVPILPLGSRGQFDCGLVSVITQPVRWRERDLVFYQGRPTVHDGKPRYPADPQPSPGIGLAEFSLGGLS
ncbi:MAG: hypothetical protein K9M98_11865 [Cephaloticoccus sp.]|nr:hypothetical protein [Cephaloticoccus sp.]MCF7761189.1 hypothetical protein [Cephaloticoccus sp.]